MLKSLMTFLILSSLAGCATGKIETRFNGKWKFCKDETGKTMACLNEDDVIKLREILIRCKQRCGE